MSMASAVRRSGRERKANKRYENYLLEKETLRLLRESSESSRPTSPDTSTSDEVKSDDEFDTSKLEETQVSANEEDDLSLISGSGRGLSESSNIETTNETDENISIATSGISGPEDYEGKSRGPGTRRFKLVSTDSHSRGLQLVHRNANREVIWGSLAGSSEQDILSLLFAREQWKWRRDITFPSRKSLAETASQGVYGNVSRFGVPENDLRTEATTGWDWYQEEVGERFRKRQRLENADDSQTQKHIAFSTKRDFRIVMGPTDGQQAYHFAHLAAMDFGQAWENGAAPTWKRATNDSANNGTAEGDNNIQQDTPSYPARSRYREGWLLGLGSKVQCLAWAPNSRGGDTQYLALSTSCSSEQMNSVPVSKDRRAPAFRPSPPYPSSIQIWGFRCQRTNEGLQKLDMFTQPRLVQVLCTNWGNIRQLQWCPVLRESRDLPEQETNQAGYMNLGLLGVIASDGRARVLDVSVPRATDPGPQILSVESAAFDTLSSSSIYTCLSFVSPCDLLCGTSSGSVDLFNILPNHEVFDQGSPLPTPYLTTQQSLTYILNISPAYPSPFPNLLVSTSMNGTPTLADLRSPSTDRVIGKTARIANKNLVYSPHLRSYLFTSEDDCILAYPVRRFYSGVRVARFTEQGSLTALATSRWHPCLLFGTSSGTLSCTNILRRVLPSVKRGADTGAWIQKLCEHHWTPEASSSPSPAPAAPVPSTPTTITINPLNSPTNPAPPTPQPEPSPFPSSFHPHTRSGTSRFHDSFKASKHELSAQAKIRARGGSAAIAAKTGTETIYEEEQAVTAAEWNPNLSCAGWLAVGWGSGVVRVEDVGHDGV